MHMKRTCVYLLQIAILLAGAAGAQAQGAAFTYQGRLMDTNGVINGSAAMVFRLYATVLGGAPLWQETHNSIPVSNGLFSVILGRGLAADETIFTGAARWLGISVNGGAELTPRA